ncbi:hypothetical protein [Lacticaseibacillus rhamnosus]|uniref:hypothetical protein n=1 Tax=Lacticaseibacillus rhamnosus TaxID=47715 RepID=UPI002916E8B4|nr:hypothetical protein [Lacticaseibacillus rhamnosus]WNX11173.1 hypothetical protein RWA17_12755 [Lacticaseibacillus rhamnosus]
MGEAAAALRPLLPFIHMRQLRALLRLYALPFFACFSRATSLCLVCTEQYILQVLFFEAPFSQAASRKIRSAKFTRQWSFYASARNLVKN